MILYESLAFTVSLLCALCVNWAKKLYRVYEAGSFFISQIRKPRYRTAQLPMAAQLTQVEAA